MVLVRSARVTAAEADRYQDVVGAVDVVVLPVADELFPVPLNYLHRQRITCPQPIQTSYRCL
jgi:hypothetical protein